MRHSNHRQGEALGHVPGLAARWISFPHVFLFAPPPSVETLRSIGPDRKPCIGFNLLSLAKALALDAGHLLLSNQNRLLTVRIDPIPAAESTPLSRFRFGLLGRGSTAEFVLPSL